MNADVMIAALAGAVLGGAAGGAAIFLFYGLPRRPSGPRRPQATPEEIADALNKARIALARMRASAHAYKALADQFERSLEEARAEADAARKEAAQLRAAYVQRTQQALHAGFTIVLDHGSTRRNP